MPVEQLQYNLLFKWFVGLQIEEKMWNATTFTKNRDRLTDKSDDDRENFHGQKRSNDTHQSVTNPAVLSIHERPLTRATSSVNGSENGWKRSAAVQDLSGA